MSGARTVVIATTVSMLVFLAAGGRFEKVVAKLGGKNEAETEAATIAVGRTLVAWAALFVMLTILADFPATEQIASAFALLIMLTMILAYGVDAFENIARTVGGGAGRGGPPKPNGTERHGPGPHTHVE